MWGCSCEKWMLRRRSFVYFKLHLPASWSDIYLATKAAEYGANTMLINIERPFQQFAVSATETFKSAGIA
jgi:hypothetical protein